MLDFEKCTFRKHTFEDTQNKYSWKIQKLKKNALENRHSNQEIIEFVKVIRNIKYIRFGKAAGITWKIRVFMIQSLENRTFLCTFKVLTSANFYEKSLENEKSFCRLLYVQSNFTFLRVQNVCQKIGIRLQKKYLNTEKLFVYFEK